MSARIYTSRPVADRFWAKVDTSGECWLWTGHRNNHGYGTLCVGSQQDGSKRTTYAHRWAWEEKNGAIPDGLEIDHLCRNPPCVRPEHLEAVTHQENNLRGRPHNRFKTHCPRGHLYDGANTYLYDGRRTCRICQQMARSAYEQRKGSA